MRTVSVCIASMVALSVMAPAAPAGADVSTAGVTPTSQVQVSQPAVLRVTTTRLPGAERTRPYSAGLTSVGGRGRVTWRVTAGALPPGMSLTSDGVVRGTPTVAAAGRFTVRARDSRGRTATRTVQVAVVPRGGMVLDPVRIGPVKRGGSVTSVVAGLTGVLGTPDSASWTAGCPFSGANAGYVARWGAFSVYGEAASKEKVRVTTWVLTRESLPAKIVTRDRISIGTPMTTVQRTYPRVTIDKDSPFGGPAEWLVTDDASTMAWWVGARSRRVVAMSMNPQFCD